MKTLQEQEIFEIEILEWIKKNNFFENLIFGGGTMLRLCYDLNRFSLDLDFWTYRIEDFKNFFKLLNSRLSNSFELTDAEEKFYTILFEIRRPGKPGKLKIEIRKTKEDFDFQEKIAFSKYSNIQVLVKAFTLEQMMKNKLVALVARKEIRDAFDIEFLLKKGIEIVPGLKSDSKSEIKYGKGKIYNDLEKIKKIIIGFTKQNYKVSLGSLLDQDQRKYYIENNFTYLLSKI